MQVFKAAQHLRMKPLSVNDRRTIPIPPVSAKPLARLPLSQVVNKRIDLTKSHQSRSIPTKAPPALRVQPPVKTTTANIEQYRGIGTNKDLIIVGNGPSHAMAPLQLLKGLLNVDIMSVNKPDERLWPTTSWVFCDNTQRDRHRAIWETYTGPCFNTPSVKDERSNTVRLSSMTNFGFSDEITKGVFIGRSSVYTAMQIALWMGYDHIYIFGCDMGPVDGRLYPWGSNPDVSDAVRAKRFEGEALNYQWAADNLDPAKRSRFTFCTEFNPFPFVKQFNALGHQEAVYHIVNKHTPKDETEQTTSAGV